jgi:hypothetical protein
VTPYFEENTKMDLFLMWSVSHLLNIAFFVCILLIRFTNWHPVALGASISGTNKVAIDPASVTYPYPK